MIVQIIGSWCIFSAALGEIALIACAIQKDEVREGGRWQANVLIVGQLAIAAWCFK